MTNPVYVQVHTRYIRDLATSYDLPLKGSLMNNVKIPVGNLPKGFENVEALTFNQLVSLIRENITGVDFGAEYEQKFQDLTSQLLREINQYLDQILNGGGGGNNGGGASAADIRLVNLDSKYAVSNQNYKGLLVGDQFEAVQAVFNGSANSTPEKIKPHSSTIIQFKPISNDGFVNNLTPFKRQFDNVYTLGLQNINSIFRGLAVAPKPFVETELFGQSITRFRYVGKTENFSQITGTIRVLVKIYETNVPEEQRLAGKRPVAPPSLWFELRAVNKPTAERSARRGLAMDIPVEGRPLIEFDTRLGTINTGMSADIITIGGLINSELNAEIQRMLAQGSVTDVMINEASARIMANYLLTNRDVPFVTDKRILSGSVSEELTNGTGWRTTEWIDIKGSKRVGLQVYGGTTSVSRVQWKRPDGKIIYGDGQGSNDVGIPQDNILLLEVPYGCTQYRVGFANTVDTAFGIAAYSFAGEANAMGGYWMSYQLDVNSTVMFSPNTEYEFTMQFYGENFKLNKHGFYIQSGGLNCEMNITDELYDAVRNF